MSRRAKTPSARTCARLRKRLLTAQRELFADIVGAEHDLDVIEGTREAEFGERSQEEAAAALLEQLEERRQREFREIRAALVRIDTGAYGRCTECDARIAVKRLEALPATPLCAACEQRAESRAAAMVGEESEYPVRNLPPELADLSDAEIAEVVREHFEDEVGGDLRGIRVGCRHGVVTLAGEVGSDELRQVAMQIVEDDIGLDAVDHVRITQIAAEGRGRRRQVLPDDVGLDLSEARYANSDDVFAVEEDGVNYSPPDRPVPEKE